MDGPKDRVFRGSLSSAEVERLYPARVARIARGELSYADRGRIKRGNVVHRPGSGAAASSTASNISIFAFPNRAPAWPLI